MTHVIYRVVVVTMPGWKIDTRELLSLGEARRFYDDRADEPGLKERHILRVRTEPVQGEQR